MKLYKDGKYNSMNMTSTFAGKDNNVSEGLSKPPETTSRDVFKATQPENDGLSISSGATCHTSPIFIKFRKIIKRRIFNNNISQIYIAKNTNLVTLMKNVICDNGTMCIFFGTLTYSRKFKLFRSIFCP